MAGSRLKKIFKRSLIWGQAGRDSTNTSSVLVPHQLLPQRLATRVCEIQPFAWQHLQPHITHEHARSWRDTLAKLQSTALPAIPSSPAAQSTEGQQAQLSKDTEALPLRKI